jgi:hypothetical protein
MQNGEFALVVQPGPAVGEPGMHPVPCHRLGFPIAGGVGDGRHLRLVPGVGLGQGEGSAVLAGSASLGAVTVRWCGSKQHPVGAETAHQLDRQVREDESEAGDVVAGVHHDQDVRVTVAPVPCSDDPVDNFAELGGGHRSGVVGRAQPHRVQQRGPGCAPGLQGSDEGVGPARDELRVALGPPVDMTEQPLRAGRRIGPQPRRDIDRQHDPPIGRPG